MLSVEDVSQYVAYEGLGYCIYAYIAPEKITDPNLRRLWKEAQDALRKVNSFLLRYA
jgi:hypothetical protein